LHPADDVPVQFDVDLPPDVAVDRDIPVAVTRQGRDLAAVGTPARRLVAVEMQLLVRVGEVSRWLAAVGRDYPEPRWLSPLGAGIGD
jgi:hypothetical protein